MRAVVNTQRVNKQMSDKARWLHTELSNELHARRLALMAERGTLTKAQVRILEIDEMVALIDEQLGEQAAKLDALPKPAPVEESVDAATAP